MIHLEIESCSAFCSIQDRGRTKFRYTGIPRSGALDLLALAAANALVGNPAWSAGIELLAGDICLRAVGGPIRLALAGAEYRMTIDGAPVGNNTSFMIYSGQRLCISGPRRGVCGVLAIEGGFDIAEALGSCSLHTRSRLGGFQGRRLGPGDRLPVNREVTTRDEHFLSTLDLGVAKPIRVVLGPQLEYFSPSTIDAFLSQPFVVSQGDRMGYRLSGPTLAGGGTASLISEGLIEGCIQVTAAGEPIILLADHQTIGGYPKIACVITSDLRVIAQRQVGTTVRFSAVSIAEAQTHFARWTSALAALPAQVRRRDSELDVDAIADNVVSAVDPATWDARTNPASPEMVDLLAPA